MKLLILREKTIKDENNFNIDWLTIKNKDQAKKFSF